MASKAAAKTAGKTTYVRIQCSESHLHQLRSHSVALHGRDTNGALLKGEAGRPFCTLKVGKGHFQVFDRNGLNPKRFQVFKGELPPEIAEAVQKGYLVLDEVPADEVPNLADNDIFDPADLPDGPVAHMKPERIQ